MDLIVYVIPIILGYLLGAIPTGLIVGKLLKGIDLREYGSGKTGATNALRTLGPISACIVICADLFKGILATLIAHALLHTTSAQCLAGIAAVIGHNWPVYAHFRGGRGVLVSYSVFWILCWPAALMTSIVGIPIIAVSRFVSLGVLVGTGVGIIITLPLVIFAQYSPWIIFYALVGGTLLFARHGDNIIRLLSGTERKLGQSVHRANRA